MRQQSNHMQQAPNTPHENEPRYLALAREATLSGLTRDRVIAALHSRIRRDEGYLAYRKATGRYTRYDEAVQGDLRAMALAICYLEEPAPTTRR
jgi:hypothetical protein